MKKHLAIKPDYQKIQIGEIDKVITQLKTGGTPEEAANKISERLYTSLENGCLDLSYCQISDEILSQILPLLSVLNITKLNLSSNWIEDKGANILAKALKTNTSLITLDLSRCEIGDDGAMAIAKALEINQTLKDLYLSLNNILTAGATALAEALKTNSKLKELNIRCNNLGDDGAKALTEALKTNKSLTQLDLYGNNLGPAGAKALADALKINTSLTELFTGLNKKHALIKPIDKELDINKKIASIDKEALTTILTIGVLNKYFAGPLFATYLIGDDAVQKLQTISSSS